MDRFTLPKVSTPNHPACRVTAKTRPRKHPLTSSTTDSVNKWTNPDISRNRECNSLRKAGQCYSALTTLRPFGGLILRESSSRDFILSPVTHDTPSLILQSEENCVAKAAMRVKKLWAWTQERRRRHNALACRCAGVTQLISRARASFM